MKKIGTTKRTGKLTSHFKENESYQHLYAKEVLKKWILFNPCLTGYDVVKVVLERDFSMNGFVYFKPDIALYDANGIKAVYEVTKTNPISITKLNRMVEFCKVHEWNLDIYEIKASWIMDKTSTPDKLKFERIINI